MALHGKLITLSEARRRLGISKPTMTRVMREQQFTLYENPLDKRVKLVCEDEVEALRQPRRIAAEGKAMAAA